MGVERVVITVHRHQMALSSNESTVRIILRATMDALLDEGVVVDLEYVDDDD